MSDLLDIRRIYVEPAAAELPRGKEILARYPDAERVEVESHHRIPELYGDETNVNRWVRIKREALVLGVKKSLTARPNGRSADFIAPSTANGCAMACAYCYVPRRKGYANPITVFTNIDKIIRYLRGHGPAGLADFRWWAGLPLGLARSALDGAGTRAGCRRPAPADAGRGRAVRGARGRGTRPPRQGREAVDRGGARRGK